MSQQIRVFRKLKKREVLETSVEIYDELDYRFVPVWPLEIQEIEKNIQKTVYFKHTGALSKYLVTGFALVLITIILASYFITGTGLLQRGKNEIIFS